MSFNFLEFPSEFRYRSSPRFQARVLKFPRRQVFFSPPDRFGFSGLSLTCRSFYRQGCNHGLFSSRQMEAERCGAKLMTSQVRIREIAFGGKEGCEERGKGMLGILIGLLDFHGHSFHLGDHHHRFAGLLWLLREARPTRDRRSCSHADANDVTMLQASQIIRLIKRVCGSKVNIVRDLFPVMRVRSTRTMTLDDVIPDVPRNLFVSASNSPNFNSSAGYSGSKLDYRRGSGNFLST
ncbi:hypothetical protein PoB_003587800 [Plakobranchus ocellatus]|uniref:Uncharacterized protein n=1 Tax=Plakobranchus ocellatus TaxID=259542 RepID=A0AAV4AS29_9GAST|nr:hypothetical protein PoB_003587800 [Plakobranchus ocellatus]